MMWFSPPKERDPTSEERTTINKSMKWLAKFSIFKTCNQEPRWGVKRPLPMGGINILKEIEYRMYYDFNNSLRVKLTQHCKGGHVHTHTFPFEEMKLFANNFDRNM